MNTNYKAANPILLFRTPNHTCSYKGNQKASTIFVDPDLLINKSLNSKLSELGYRRSGSHLYRPDCEICHACTSCRIPANLFHVTRAHRKLINKNSDLYIVEKNDLTCEQSYKLYERYINIRHYDGDMYPATREQFEAFIKTKTIDTRFFMFYLENKLISVSVTDSLENDLSAGYTFFEPTEIKRSLGIFSILYQLQICHTLSLPYLFLGYWIKDCPKMQYKSNFQPIEMLIDGKWIIMK